MCATIMIDDTLLEQAMRFAKPGTSRDELVKEAVLTYIHLQAGHHLAELGGSAPEMADIPRRRPTGSGE